MTGARPPGGLLGERLVVHKCDSLGREVARYQGTVVAHDERSLALRARWTLGTCEAGLFVFENDDHLLEIYYFARWWNVFELRRADGRLRGWYCNIARPARLLGRDLYWDDLALDLVVSPSGAVRLLDEDEFEALHLAQREPRAYDQALQAVAEIRALVQRADPPFQALRRGDIEPF